MTARSSVTARPRVVGVIASRADLDRLGGVIDQLERQISRLRAPVIITARHPQEGGANKLSARQRRDLLTRFLPPADYVDIELRPASALRSVLILAKQKEVQ